jgi:hypothetical protein
VNEPMSGLDPWTLRGQYWSKRRQIAANCVVLLWFAVGTAWLHLLVLTLIAIGVSVVDVVALVWVILPTYSVREGAQ